MCTVSALSSFIDVVACIVNYWTKKITPEYKYLLLKLVASLEYLYTVDWSIVVTPY